jgi:hypothetical protein
MGNCNSIRLHSKICELLKTQGKTRADTDRLMTIAGGEYPSPNFIICETTREDILEKEFLLHVCQGVAFSRFISVRCC